jgi:CheY-like chemotaxis protein
MEETGTTAAAPAARPVLVVDDDAGIRTLVTAALTHAGHRVVAAADGEAGLTLAAATEPFLILLDVAMPRVDGWGFLDAYHRAPGPHAPILLFTAEPGAAAQARAVRVDGIIAKPVVLAELQAVVRRYADVPAPPTDPEG